LILYCFLFQFIDNLRYVPASAVPITRSEFTVCGCGGGCAALTSFIRDSVAIWLKKNCLILRDRDWSRRRILELRRDAEGNVIVVVTKMNVLKAK